MTLDRTDLYMQMLDATAKLQYEISLMLEARVVEASKSQNWICQHINTTNLEGHDHKMKVTGQIHESVIELIDGLTKMENALNRQMKALIGKHPSGSALGLGSDDAMEFGSLLPFGEDGKL
ncbi:hypothetical protein PAECIP111891_06575 [Paenibacillus allorhizoplanae]|uniref:Restriction endonuclease subunit S n=1 Tax=Paenibacillus allorhizoplanae TaxID=2905648 RepID=A0ABN8H579_9BACL|nr:hypothetical protein [Paenibacillus allorhizoplanae]CAH1229925.1 hypothetical protein PAECIP111891_06575 [Paenibacillus allorhizoplanae]